MSLLSRKNWLIVNKKATYQYKILERWEAGIVLKGTEVKSIRGGGVSFTDSFVRIRRGEIFLHNLHIAPYSATSFEYDPKRERKLLLHKSQIRKLTGILTQKGFTLIPLCIYFKKNKVKVEIGLAKGKKLYDKREKIKRKTVERETRHILKYRNFK